MIDYVIKSCETDLETYCSQVTPGQGRLMYCVAAHEDKISGQCGYALYQAATLLEQLSMAITYLAESCGSEIETLCGDVALGEGRVLTCLDTNQAELGETCSAALTNTVAQ
ncbi:cysteine rich repeat domain protein, putative [Luminiphilus syltensis NOR5-1B]|uniref:Cysteine rich repeat domain protein, putative n=2 Tax=Luminiphilus TaxID=1341118 RepID=B8KTI2_9GAMM|nr:cysteine rich repeat domain protein, putative [Luminiphilus syltensis NOR5-1B]